MFRLGDKVERVTDYCEGEVVYVDDDQIRVRWLSENRVAALLLRPNPNSKGYQLIRLKNEE
jgi:hypothetical protein